MGILESLLWMFLSVLRKEGVEVVSREGVLVTEVGFAWLRGIAVRII